MAFYDISARNLNIESLQLTLGTALCSTDASQLYGLIKVSLSNPWDLNIALWIVFNRIIERSSSTFYATIYTYFWEEGDCIIREFYLTRT